MLNVAKTNFCIKAKARGLIVLEWFSSSIFMSSFGSAYYKSIKMISLRVRSRFQSNTKDQKWLKLKTARLIFSKTAPLYKKTANFDPRWSTPLRLRFVPFLIALSVLLLQELFKKSNLDFIFKIFVFSLLFCFIQEDLSPDLNMRSFSDTRVFVKLEFS